MLKSVLSLVVVVGGVWLAAPSKNNRIHNFSAGPGSVPLEVLLQAEANLLSWNGHGMALFEMSHRDVGGPVQTMLTDSSASMRRLLSIPDNYDVFYVQGGAHGQFSAVPLNLGGAPDATADYVVTGFWSERSRKEGAKFLNARKLSGLTPDGNGLLPASEWGVDPSAAYIHVCAGETIDSIEYLDDALLELPTEVAHIPIVADFTSTLLSRPVDVTKYGVIYASAGKNLGPAGMAVVIVRRDLLGKEDPRTPSVLSWQLSANSQPVHSIYNTPPTLALWFHSMVVSHMEAAGGMPAVEAAATRRAAQVYDVVDTSAGFYVNTVRPAYRSRMNVALTIEHPAGESRRDLEERFIKEAADSNMVQLFGHKVRGGIRITLYYGVAQDSIDAVTAFMRDFQARVIA